MSGLEPPGPPAAGLAMLQSTKRCRDQLFEERGLPGGRKTDDVDSGWSL
jgi:hypothetical protein